MSDGSGHRAAIAVGVVTLIALAAATPAMAGVETLVQSRFGEDADGWVVRGDPVLPAPVFHSSGGQQGGYISATDSQQGETMYWKAPEKFTGNFRSAYGGILSLAWRQSLDSNPSGQGKGIVLRGANRVALCCALGPFGTDWINLQVNLRETHWMKPGGGVYTKSQFKRILASVNLLKIQAEFDLGAETDSLDSVRILALD